MAFSRDFIRNLPGLSPETLAEIDGVPVERPAAPPPLPEISEADFMARVVKLAKESGWACFHPYDSRRSEAGWPDLALCRPPRLILAELKSADGKLKPAQKKWITLLRKCNGVEAFVWWPRDFEAIERLLA